MPGRRWDADLLLRLDWKRFQDLVRVLVTKAGYRVRPLLVGEAGVCLMSLVNGSRRRPEALLGCAPWNQPVVSGRLLAGFHQEVVNRGFPRGTFFTPGRFHSDAADFAGVRPIERVDARDFVAVLARLSAAEAEHLLKLTTAGEFGVPTCPACSIKLALRDSEMPEGAGKLKNLTVRRSETFVGDVRCNRLTIGRGAEAQFLKGVYANRLVVHGRAMGNFTCRGAAKIGVGAWVVGSVAARSVELEPGGIVDGEMRILDEVEVRPVRVPPHEPIWGCPNYPKCRVVLPVRKLDAPGGQAGEA